MGAVAVNLVPGKKPADIYSEIAARWVSSCWFPCCSYHISCKHYSPGWLLVNFACLLVIDVL